MCMQKHVGLSVLNECLLGLHRISLAYPTGTDFIRREKTQLATPIYTDIHASISSSTECNV